MVAQCAYVSLSCVNVSILCVLYKCSCKDSQKDSTRSDKRGGCGTRDTAKEMHSLFRYNKYRGL